MSMILKILIRIIIIIILFLLFLFTPRIIFYNQITHFVFFFFLTFFTLRLLIPYTFKSSDNKITIKYQGNSISIHRGPAIVILSILFSLHTFLYESFLTTYSLEISPIAQDSCLFSNFADSSFNVVINGSDVENTIEVNSRKISISLPRYYRGDDIRLAVKHVECFLKKDTFIELGYLDFSKKSIEIKLLPDEEIFINKVKSNYNNCINKIEALYKSYNIGELNQVARQNEELMNYFYGLAQAKKFSNYAKDEIISKRSELRFFFECKKTLLPFLNRRNSLELEFESAKGDLKKIINIKSRLNNLVEKLISEDEFCVREEREKFVDKIIILLKLIEIEIENEN